MTVLTSNDIVILTLTPIILVRILGCMNCL
jgi:hypothetical protein